jgi:hypothetical protein
MDQSEIQDLRELVKIDKEHIINFMQAHGFKVIGNVKLQYFSDTDTDLIDPKVDDIVFRNLWQLDLEPELVFAEFKIAFPDKLNKKEFTMTLLDLTNKISHRAWPDNPNEIRGYLKEFPSNCPHWQRIEIATPKTRIEIKLYAHICYHC